MASDPALRKSYCHRKFVPTSLASRVIWYCVSLGEVSDTVTPSLCRANWRKLKLDVELVRTTLSTVNVQERVASLHVPIIQLGGLIGDETAGAPAGVPVPPVGVLPVLLLMNYRYRYRWRLLDIRSIRRRLPSPPPAQPICATELVPWLGIPKPLGAPWSHTSHVVAARRRWQSRPGRFPSPPWSEPPRPPGADRRPCGVLSTPRRRRRASQRRGDAVLSLRHGRFRERMG